MFSLDIQKDEIFSSWLTRLAMRNGCDALDLSSYLWGKQRVWISDIDRQMDNLKLDDLLVACRIDFKALKGAFLHTHSQLISNNQEQAIWPWILPLGCRNRKRFSGMQFCPECLNEDESPYFRVHWRFAWHTCCMKHKIRLLDRCPNCSAAIEYHRLEADVLHLNYCASCHYDLTKAPSKIVDDAELSIQKRCDLVHLNGLGSFGAQSLDSQQWFLTLRFFIMLIQKARNTNLKSIHELLRRLEIDKSSVYFSTTGFRLELLRTHERAKLIRQGFKLLLIEPNYFKDSLNSLNINAGYLKNIINPLPVKISEMVPGERKLFNKRKVDKEKYKPKSKRTVLMMHERLKRRLENLDR